MWLVFTLDLVRSLSLICEYVSLVRIPCASRPSDTDSFGDPLPVGCLVIPNSVIRVAGKYLMINV